MSLAVVNIGDSHSGGLQGAAIDGDALVVEHGVITWIGSSSDIAVGDHEEVLDAGGATAIPGLIDSHVHTTFGDYTPRQQTIGFLDSYLHGGTTRVISASEVHVPGRPTDVVGVKALAVAAYKSYEHYRPSGMTVHGGSVILEPGLTRTDFEEVHAAGVRMAKGGFGAFADARDYIPVVADARAAGITVMCHSGGGSIPGSRAKISAELLLEMRPNVAGHVNGGPTSLTAEENVAMVEQGGDIAMQLVHAGNLRSAIHLAEMLLARDELHRILLATDTPTGTGVIPLGMLRIITELTSLGPFTPRQAISASTGNVPRIYGIPGGVLEVGAAADLALVDAPLGSAADNAFDAIARGDIPAVAAVVTEGVVRFTKSRNTPPAQKPAVLRHP
ncbi:amidohydrolase family protein [Microbacterium oryzae]|uniref:amidohydrolase family protein n=1 Tax=Microbacterium oryzae TaxID=743009 RepID=UPI0025AF3BEB|nr:amidohydrolase family protein [Microbacterium oryzae]MDN3309766.1 amidohydrolase family protein [Microbacterium oryzae]